MKYGTRCMKCREALAVITVKSSIGRDKHLCEGCKKRNEQNGQRKSNIR